MLADRRPTPPEPPQNLGIEYWIDAMMITVAAFITATVQRIIGCTSLPLLTAMICPGPLPRSMLIDAHTPMPMLTCHCWRPAREDPLAPWLCLLGQKTTINLEWKQSFIYNGNVVSGPTAATAFYTRPTIHRWLIAMTSSSATISSEWAHNITS